MKKIFFWLMTTSLISFNSNAQLSKVKDFAIKHIEISQKITTLLESEKNEHFTTLPSEIETSKSQQKLLTFIKDAGVANANELLSLFNEDEANKNAYLSNNADFLRLTEQQRKDLFVSTMNDLLEPIPSDTGKRTCNEQYLIDLHRCQRDYAIELGLSWVATVGTGGWGAIGFVAAVISYENCESDAISDATDCRGGR